MEYPANISNVKDSDYEVIMGSWKCQVTTNIFFFPQEDFIKWILVLI